METKIEKVKKVKKRDGSIVDFNDYKIIKAIKKAFNSSGEHCVDTENDFLTLIECEFLNKSYINFYGNFYLFVFKANH